MLFWPFKKSSSIKIDKQLPRCPYCHDNILEGTLLGCRCGALFHIDCGEELGRCPTCYTNLEVLGARKAFMNKSKIPVQELIAKIKSDPYFIEVYNIAKCNSKGPVWLAGGKVYRNLLEIIHGTPAGSDFCDYDFLTTKGVWWKYVPEQWYHTCTNEYGNTSLMPSYFIAKVEGVSRFTKRNPPPEFGLSQSSGHQIDLLAFNKLPGIVNNGFSQDLTGYFKSVPLDIQAIALDLENNELLGEKGIQAVLNRKININYYPQAVISAEHKHISVEEYIRAKATSLGIEVGNTKDLSK